MYNSKHTNIEDDIRLFENNIKNLDVPEDKKKANPMNARWFIRSGYVMNRNHPLASVVLEAARKLA